jgi:hypothetical protein
VPSAISAKLLGLIVRTVPETSLIVCRSVDPLVANIFTEYELAFVTEDHKTPIDFKVPTVAEVVGVEGAGNCEAEVVAEAPPAPTSFTARI